MHKSSSLNSTRERQPYRRNTYPVCKLNNLHSSILNGICACIQCTRHYSVHCSLSTSLRFLTDAFPFFFTYLAGDDISSSTREGSISPTSLTSSGATSLQQDDQDGGGGASSASSAEQSSMESSCKQLLGVVEELAYYHSQIQTIT